VPAPDLANLRPGTGPGTPQGGRRWHGASCRPPSCVRPSPVSGSGCPAGCRSSRRCSAAASAAKPARELASDGWQLSGWSCGWLTGGWTDARTAELRPAAGTRSTSAWPSRPWA
jgi:hypothetical protein